MLTMYACLKCADDNELCQRLVNPLQHGVRLHAVIDACHSGSALDLPFRCKVGWALAPVVFEDRYFKAHSQILLPKSGFLLDRPLRCEVGHYTRCLEHLLLHDVFAFEVSHGMGCLLHCHPAEAPSPAFGHLWHSVIRKPGGTAAQLLQRWLPLQ